MDVVGSRGHTQILDTSSEFIFGQSLDALENPDTAFMQAFEYA